MNRLFGTRHPGVRPLAVAALLALAAASACASGDDGEASASGDGETGVIKIAAVVDITGAGQATGAPQVHGAQAAIEDINANGGIEVEGTTYTLELVPLDHANDPARVVANANDALDQGALAVLSPSLRFDAFYNMVKDEVITIGSAFPEQGLLLEALDEHPALIVQIPFLHTYYESMFEQVTTRYPDLDRVALLNTDNDNGPPEAAGIAAAAEAQGLTVVDSIFYPEGTEDFAPFLSRLDGNDVDLLVGPINPASSIPLLIQAAQLDTAPYGLTQALNPTDLGDLSAFGDMTLINSHFSVSFGEYNFEDINEAGERLVELAGETPIVPEIAVDMWNTIHVLALGIEEAGTVEDPAAVVEAMKDVSYEGPFGFAELTDDQAVVGPAMYHFVEDGNVTVALYESLEELEPLRTEEFPLG